MSKLTFNVIYCNKNLLNDVGELMGMDYKFTAATKVEDFIAFVKREYGFPPDVVFKVKRVAEEREETLMQNMKNKLFDNGKYELFCGLLLHFI